MSTAIIEKFYQSFQELNPEKMAECYHKDVIFNDPVFRNLNYDEATAMWTMLIQRSNGVLEIDFHTVIGDSSFGQCIWEANYMFSKTNNPVHNVIHATMEFQDGLIIKHTDEFNFWKWSSMALGIPGKLLGWTPFLKGKVQKMANGSLKKFMKEER